MEIDRNNLSKLERMNTLSWNLQGLTFSGIGLFSVGLKVESLMTQNPEHFVLSLAGLAGSAYLGLRMSKHPKENSNHSYAERNLSYSSLREKANLRLIK